MRSISLFVIATASAAAFAGVADGQAKPLFDLPEGDGREQVMNACTGCHGIDQVTAQRRSGLQWSSTIDQMVARGASISEQEFPLIVGYLTKHFGAAPSQAEATTALAPPPR